MVAVKQQTNGHRQQSGNANQSRSTLGVEGFQFLEESGSPQTGVRFQLGRIERLARGAKRHIVRHPWDCTLSLVSSCLPISGSIVNFSMCELNDDLFVDNTDLASNEYRNLQRSAHQSAHQPPKFPQQTRSYAQPRYDPYGSACNCSPNCPCGCMDGALCSCAARGGCGLSRKSVFALPESNSGSMYATQHQMTNKDFVRTTAGRGPAVTQQRTGLHADRLSEWMGARSSWLSDGERDASSSRSYQQAQRELEQYGTLVSKNAVFCSCVQCGNSIINGTNCPKCL